MINYIKSECSKLATRLSGQVDPPRIVQEIEIWPYELMVYVQLEICPREWDAQNSLGF